MKKILLAGLTVISMISMTSGQDRMFAYTYQSNVLNKGDFDLEFQNTLAVGKKGNYSPYLFGQHLDQRIEFEFGLGKKVQTAFYLNSELFNFADTAAADISQELKISFSNEWKWKLSDPVANKIGFALYEELEVGGNNFEFETKLIFDKRWQHDLIAFNIVGTYEFEAEIEQKNDKPEMEWEHETALEFDLGYMHFFKNQCGLGFEARNNNDKGDKWMNSVLFAGPAFHATAGKFFTNISVLPQLANLRKTEFAPGSKDYNNYEKAEFRILVGYNF